jgi:protein-S-isoprenylcysteine O-methyltransferase Ste14
MSLVYNYLLPAVWLGYLAYWWARSKNVKANQRRESAPSRWARRLLLICAAALLGLPRIPILGLDGRFHPASVAWFWCGAAVTIGGLLFAVWARRHLGRNWSSTVTVKTGHELITTGPYAWVRHPIYSGLLLAFVGSALARGEWRGLLAVALVAGIFWHKLRLEEKWMREQFGESYAAYCARVAALVPFVL